MYNILTEPLIRVRKTGGAKSAFSLSDVYAALMIDEIGCFEALRPHQRHSWHALLCQIGALACLRSGLLEPPTDAGGWLSCLRALTPEFRDDEPWSLISESDTPAFLQAPVDTTKGFRRLTTPDELDILVTSKNHDIKRARLAAAQPDDWLFALTSLQTMAGFLGNGNYGISRMNGGFSNRPGFSIAPHGGIGAHIARDLRRLIDLREDMLTKFDYDDNGLALVWTLRWDGTTSLQPNCLDPYYVEICRRVRFVIDTAGIAALIAGSKRPRIALGIGAKGVTGDPWTPIEIRDGEAKALSIDARGFSYERLSKIFFGIGFEPAPLQKIVASDGCGGPLTLTARALVRGQGKTEGLHERRVLVTRKIVRLLAEEHTQELAGTAAQRFAEAAKVCSALRFALGLLLQHGHSESSTLSVNLHKTVARTVSLLEVHIDSNFFVALFAEIENDSELERTEIRRIWLIDLYSAAMNLLRIAEFDSPISLPRRYRAIVRAESAFKNSFFKALRDPYFPKNRTTTQSETDSQPHEQSSKPDFAFEIYKIIAAFAASARRGELAQLRRMDPDEPQSATFFRILAKVAPDAAPEMVRRLAIIVNIFALKPEALSPGPHGKTINLGFAMAQTGISETRVQRFLIARENALFDQVRLLARRLACSGAIPWRDLAHLILWDGSALDDLRLKIARDYWRALNRVQTVS